MTQVPLAEAIEILKRTDLVRRASSHSDEPWKLSTHPDDDFDEAFLVLDPDDDAWTLRFTRGANQTVTVLEEGGTRMVLQSLEEGAPVEVWLYNRTGVSVSTPPKRVVTCVYCGHEYPTGTPTAQDELLTAHIKVCESHPMRRAERRIERLYKALADIVGAHDPKELTIMEGAIRAAAVPDQDKVSMLNAIHTLIDEAPTPDTSAS